jgi:hypothetical protein
MTPRNVLSLTGAALLLLSTAACGGSSDGNPTSAAPTVLSTVPSSAATGVATITTVRATFSDAMSSASLTAATYTLSTGNPAAPVAGAVTSSGASATFTPAAPLAAGTTYTATLTTGVRSSMDVAMAASRTWSFTTAAVGTPGLPVTLGSAGGFAILAKAGVSTVPTSAITGDVGVSPAAATAITGFGLTADASGVFSTSPQVTGQVFAASYTSPTPSDLTAAVGAMELAFTSAAGRTADVTELGAGDVGGLTLPPGVYKWGTGLLIPTDVTLAGLATDVWVFQVAQGLTMSSGATVLLTGGAKPAHVFWQVSGAVTLGTTAHLEGIVLGQTSVALATGATVNGRLLAQTAVTLDGNTVVEPAP